MAAISIQTEENLIEQLLNDPTYYDMKFIVACCTAYCSLPDRQMLPAEFSFSVFSINRGFFYSLDSLFDPGKIKRKHYLKL